MASPTPIDLSRHLADHTPEAIRSRLLGGPTHSYLEDFVLGAVDGAVTTFAVVSGVVGASFPTRVLLVLGAANLLADGFSMAASNFLGTRSERERREKLRRQELEHIRIYPEGEREEVRQIFHLKGLTGSTLEGVVDAITADTETWVDVMLKEQHGVVGPGPSPVRAALSTLAAFVVVGSVPLAPFAIEALRPGTVPAPFATACAATSLAFLIVGGLKARVVGLSSVRCALETLAVGAIASALAYGVGVVLDRIT